VAVKVSSSAHVCVFESPFPRYGLTVTTVGQYN